MNGCELCPRRCKAARGSGELGFCKQASQMRISRIALHPYEEPPISGKNGSGTVFFCGCSLRCVFCQNQDISRGGVTGSEYTPKSLANELFALQDMGATNINLVTATHFADMVAETLYLVKDKLHIPIVYNTSGYESVETLKMLEGLVDIYMPDFKYMSNELAEKYSSAYDYPQIAEKAICEMYRQVGRYSYAADGTLQNGVLIRHLVLPSSRHDSIAVLKRIADLLPLENILLSLMSQYTPYFANNSDFKELHRKITSFEYSSVVEVARELGFDGFIQGHASSTKYYTPDFS